MFSSFQTNGGQVASYPQIMHRISSKYSLWKMNLIFKQFTSATVTVFLNISFLLSSLPEDIFS